jgi:hypothetical protein
VSDRQGGNHRKAAPGSPVKTIAGAAMVGGMAAAGMVWGVVGDGAVTAEAIPGPCTNCGPLPTPPVIPTPQYGNIFFQLPQSGFGINQQTCPNGACYQPIATTFFPISGQTYALGTFATGNPSSPVLTCPCTIPATANSTFPLVANANGTGTTIQLPIFMI